jgi:hypothetical protein
LHLLGVGQPLHGLNAGALTGFFMSRPLKFAAH